MSERPRRNELGLSKVEKLTSVVRHCVAGPNSVRPKGPYMVAVESNGFGLPAVDSCPGSTEECEKDCYAVESERRRATRIKMERNFKILLEAETTEGMTEKLRSLVSTYIARADRLKIPKDARRFRIHWDGDFFSVDYALAWRTVIEENPEINFFAYTRSYQPDVNVLPALTGLSNLDLFMSVDWQNVDRAAEVIQDGSVPDVRVAYLVNYYEDAEELIDKLGRRENFRTLACPENMRDEVGERILPVISSRGGACSRCTYCIDKPENWDVVFVKKGYRYRSQGELKFDEPVPVLISPKRNRQESIAQPVGDLVLAGAQSSLF